MIPIVKTDILIVGGGPAGLSTAIKLADLVNDHNSQFDNKNFNDHIKILLIDKGSSIGNHSLSGAVINPIALKELLPDIEVKDMPFESQTSKEDVLYLTKAKFYKSPLTLPYFNNEGNYLASLGKVTRWLADIAEKKGVQIYPNFAANEVLYKDNKVIGVRTKDSGVDKHGKELDNYQYPTDVHAKITIFAEGTRGSLTKSVTEKLQLARKGNPQIYSLGVKELWEVPEVKINEGYVGHTLGYPLTMDQFGGGFIYGLKKNLVAIGLVVGLDYSDPYFDTHNAFQIFKKHPFIANILKNGRLIKYGAKTIPEGGYFAVPQLYHDNMMIVGDSAGLVAMPSLKGIHLAVKSGMLAAQTAFEAIKKNDTTSKQLSLYEKLFNESYIYNELYPVRNFRQSFKKNLFLGMLQFGSQIVTGGRGLSESGKLQMDADYTHYHPISNFNGNSFLNKYKDDLNFDKVITFDKETDVFYSGTTHDEEQPSHIQILSSETCQNCIIKYDAPCQRFCPAQVFEIVNEKTTGEKSLTLHPSNCVHCKTCDIKDPYQNVNWSTPYGGDGPEYINM